MGPRACCARVPRPAGAASTGTHWVPTIVPLLFGFSITLSLLVANIDTTTWNDLNRSPIRVRVGTRLN